MKNTAIYLVKRKKNGTKRQKKIFFFLNIQAIKTPLKMGAES